MTFHSPPPSPSLPAPHPAHLPSLDTLTPEPFRAAHALAYLKQACPCSVATPYTLRALIVARHLPTLRRSSSHLVDPRRLQHESFLDVAESVTLALRGQTLSTRDVHRCRIRPSSPLLAFKWHPDLAAIDHNQTLRLTTNGRRISTRTTPPPPPCWIPPSWTLTSCKVPPTPPFGRTLSPRATAYCHLQTLKHGITHITLA